MTTNASTSFQIENLRAAIERGHVATRKDVDVCCCCGEERESESEDESEDESEYEEWDEEEWEEEMADLDAQPDKRCPCWLKVVRGCSDSTVCAFQNPRRLGREWLRAAEAYEIGAAVGHASCACWAAGAGAGCSAEAAAAFERGQRDAARAFECGRAARAVLLA